MSNHEKYHYSIKVKTSDLVILHCLRSIADYSQKTGIKRIAWGGTGEDDWINSDNCVTFHFSEPEYREDFVKESNRVLPKNSFQIMQKKDNEPATPQISY